MYKYLKKIMVLLLLIIVTTNCAPSKSSTEHKPSGKVTLDQLIIQLKTGPVVIGEDHSKTYAREAIAILIKKGYVKKLFVELPNLGDTNAPKAHVDVKIVKYITDSKREIDPSLNVSTRLIINLLTSGRKIDNFPISNLVEAALGISGIAVYFHDVPVGEDDPNQSVINGELKDRKYAVSSEGMKERNKYSQKLIASNSKDGEQGVVILAGQAHLEAEQLGAYTLQALLNISEDRVFNLSAKPVE